MVIRKILDMIIEKKEKKEPARGKGVIELMKQLKENNNILFA